MIQQNLFPFKIELTNENLTSRSGLSLIAEYFKTMNVSELTDNFIPKPSSNRAYNPSVFVNALLLLLTAGGKSLDDIRELKQEKALFEMLGIKNIPDPTSVGDFLRRNSKYLDELGNVMDGINKKILASDGISKYILDIDATEVVSEKDEAEYTYNMNKGYMPLLGTLQENGICIKDEFREGNVSPAYGHTEFYLKSKNSLPEGKTIGSVRADSASYNAVFMNKLEEDNVKYAITAKQDSSVRKAISAITNWSKPQGLDFEIGETVHSMDKSNSAFRLVVKKELRSNQRELFEEEPQDLYFYHAVAANIPEEEMDSLTVLNFHNKRGQSENINKEVKVGFGLEKMPCGDFLANALFFRLGIIAYNLFIGFKRFTPSMSRHTISTFRWKVINIAGRIVRHAGDVILKISGTLEKLNLFLDIRQKIINYA